MRPEDLFEIKKLQKRIKETNLIMKITKKQIQKLVKEEIIRYKKIKSLQEKKEHIKKQLGEIHNKEEEKTNNKMLKEWFLKNKKNNKEEDLIIGIDKLQNLLNVIGHEMTFELNHKFYDIKEVNDKGIKTDSKFIGWQYINDRYPSEEKGLMILMDDDEYFYFKLTEEERERHPYNNWEEHEADLQDKFNDNEDDDIINHI